MLSHHYFSCAVTLRKQQDLDLKEQFQNELGDRGRGRILIIANRHVMLGKVFIVQTQKKEKSKVENYKEIRPRNIPYKILHRVS